MKGVNKLSELQISDYYLDYQRKAEKWDDFFKKKESEGRMRKRLWLQKLMKKKKEQ
jgi:hypothetical protein